MNTQTKIYINKNTDITNNTYGYLEKIHHEFPNWPITRGVLISCKIYREYRTAFFVNVYINGGVTRPLRVDPIEMSFVTKKAA